MESEEDAALRLLAYGKGVDPLPQFMQDAAHGKAEWACIRFLAKELYELKQVVEEANYANWRHRTGV